MSEIHLDPTKDDLFMDQISNPSTSLSTSNSADMLGLTQWSTSSESRNDFVGGNIPSNALQPLISEWPVIDSSEGEKGPDSDERAIASNLESGVALLIWKAQKTQEYVDRKIDIKRRRIELEKRQSTVRVQRCEMRLRRLKAGLKPKQSE